MSDILYNETPGYTPNETWRKIARHNDKEIAGFFGDYRFLSNFHNTQVFFEGLEYWSVEAAYQSAKYHPNDRKKFIRFSAYEAKRYSRENKLSKEEIGMFDKVKVNVMIDCVFSKFSINKGLREQLLDTGNKILIEENWWSDKFFGVCRGEGENWMGRILMATRNYWKDLK